MSVGAVGWGGVEWELSAAARAPLGWSCGPRAATSTCPHPFPHHPYPPPSPRFENDGVYEDDDDLPLPEERAPLLKVRV